MKDCQRIRAWAGKITLDTVLKVAQHQGINVELPLQVGAHLSFHLIDLPKSEHSLPHKQPMSQRAPGDREVGLQTLEEVEGGEYH
jgi:hypothetical protein